MFRFALLTALFLLSLNSANAQAVRQVADPERVFAALRKASGAVSSIQATFKEAKYLSVLNQPKNSSGIFYYKKQDKMRWEQKAPVSYVIIINGDRLRVQEAGKEKNVGQAGRMAAQIKELMIGLVNGDFQQNKAFAQSCQESDDQYFVTLTPVNRRLKNIYTKITMVFPKNTLRLKELSFFEKNGDKSVMNFSNEKLNLSIDDGLFVNL